ncbi:hypothetical protein E0F88_27730 [Dyadobacter psychrotolerans]|uniref:Lipocalin-like domain-containing protein n=2 Tax=Dyadobacter psychrotolerans TaxID=2541721 RepID=A0A4R5DA50_9BACT|nr:hypothetical protein E0F88_27730 [Dyadobacter psychrotolerans]
MKRIFTLIPVLAILFFISSCKDKDNNLPTETDKILVNYPWNLTSVTDLSGKTISPTQLNETTRFLPLMNIEFQTGNKVVARGIGDSQVINGGTWYLINENKMIDINVSGFKGQFGLEELSNSKMRLKSTMPVGGVDQEAIMVFTPVIK